MNSENPRFLRKSSKFAKKSHVSQKSRKPSAFGVEGFRELPNLPFSEEWVNTKKEGCRKRNCLERIHPK